ncbi:MAG: O-methyltransferase [Clostridiaceae bacterium]|nr:O-methyltransferase [Clostridiaceae bacterium]
MANINHEYIDSFLLGMIPDRCGILKEMEEYAAENYVPIITPDIAGLLAVLIKSANIKSILEIGTAIGYSAIHMGLSAGEGFSITTIERNEESAAKALDFIKQAGMKDSIKIITGDAEELLKDVHGSFDMIFVDAAKGQYMEFMKDSIAKLKTGGLFVCDNVLFRGMVAERSLLIRRKITIVKRLKKFLSFISSCESLKTTIIPMGDGMSISCKLKEVEFVE